jgi:hypothetical protein
MRMGGRRAMTNLKSTRLAIVEQSIEDILDRLEAMDTTARVRELRSKARAYERAVRRWPTQAPAEEQRAAMVKCIIELHVEVMELGREQRAKT